MISIGGGIGTGGVGDLTGDLGLSGVGLLGSGIGGSSSLAAGVTNLRTTDGVSCDTVNNNFSLGHKLNKLIFKRLDMVIVKSK